MYLVSIGQSCFDLSRGQIMVSPARGPKSDHAEVCAIFAVEVGQKKNIRGFDSI
jgi:hypothetical protein